MLDFRVRLAKQGLISKRSWKTDFRAETLACACMAGLSCDKAAYCAVKE